MSETEKNQRLIDIGLRLKNFRKKMGYKSQEAFAEDVGSTRPAIAAYERGAVEPTGAFLHNLSSKFGADINFILTGKSDKDIPDFDTYLTQMGVDDLMKTIIKSYMALPPAKRKIVKEYMEELAKEISLNNTTPATKALTAVVEEPPEEKPDTLSDEEWEMVKKHRYETKVKIKGGINNNSGTINF